MQLHFWASAKNLNWQKNFGTCRRTKYKMPLPFHAVLVFFTEPDFLKSYLAFSTYFSVTMTAKNASDLQGLIANITAKSVFLECRKSCEDYE